MGDAVASSILGMVVDKLGTMVLDELRSLKGVGEELEKLRSTLSTIRNVLEDAEARPKKERALVDWLKKLKDVAYDIDDVLDEAAVRALKHKPDQFECKAVVRKCLSFPKSLQFRHEIAKKIKEIRKRLAMISEEKSSFHLREGAGEHPVVEIRPRETGFYVEESQVYGRDEDKKQIIDFLLNKCNEKNLGVISIVGLGGLGKTTLAQLVYNDDGLVSQHFANYKIWVYVSEKFEIKNVITSIIESLTKEKYELSSRALMEQDLLKQIKGKRFLLVLDDVWTEDCNHWDSLERLLNHGAKGSKVIVTTRSTDVAYVMKSDELHILSGLSDDDCWKLFENRAFIHDVNAENRNLVAIGKEIVNKCGGLPLAAKALGSALCSKREENQWRAIRDNETWTVFEDNKDILPALMLSYNHLSPRLKQCFSYCSIFPKGTKIIIKMLVQLWVAEGFVGLSYGYWYVDQLISRSFLQNVMEEDGYVDNHVVKMHDMVHNLAQFVAGDECSIVDATSRCTTSVSQNSRYTSLFLNKATPSTALILTSEHKLRTLCLVLKSLYDEEEYIYYQQVLDTIFSNLKLLRALHLRLPIKELPATIKKLVHLRYLDLSYTRLKGLPETIGLLHNMQTLKLQGTFLQTLPISIGNLVNLLTLDISFCDYFHSLPDTIGKLVHLQYLCLLSTKLQTLPPTIGTLHSLQSLLLSYCEELEVLPESIGDLENLLILDLFSCKSLHSLPKSMSSLNNLQTLDLHYCYKLHELPKNIQSMRSLKHLRIEGCHSLTSIPTGIGQLSQLQNLPMYVLGDGENDASLAELGTLMNLEGPLHIKNLHNVKDVAEASAANLREKQSIDSLVLEWDFNLDWIDENYEGIDDFEKKRKALMERVAAMDGERVRLLEDVSSSLQPHQNLRDLQIKGYVGKMLPGWMMDIGAVPFLVELKLESFARCDNLQALEQLPCLEVLELKRFPFIECLPRLGQLPCLRVLRLYMLPGVKCLGSELYGGAGAFPALEWLMLEFMLGLEEWSGIANEGGDDFLSRLSRLVLSDCPKLQALPSTFPSVEELTINADDELLPCYLEHGAFPNLKTLFVCNCIDTEDESSMPEALVRRLHSIEASWKGEKLIKWNHSMSELEQMGLETLERIATEIENKLAIRNPKKRKRRLR